MASSQHSQPVASFAEVVQMMTDHSEAAATRRFPESATETEPMPLEPEPPMPPLPPVASKPTAPVPPVQPTVISNVSSQNTTQVMSQVANPPLVDIGEASSFGYSQLGASAAPAATYGGPEVPTEPSKDADEACKADEEFQKEAENNPEVKRIIEQIIAKIPKDACGVRPPQHRKEIIKAESKCPPRTATIRRRLPSPEPDTVERITVVKSVQDVINIIIEKPSMPPPCCVERTEHEAPLRPIIRHNVVCVPPSGKCPPGTKAYEPLPESQYQKQSAAEFQQFAQQPEVAAFTTQQAYQPSATQPTQPTQSSSQSGWQRGEVEIPVTIEMPSSTRAERRPARYAAEPLSRVERIYYNWPETLEASQGQGSEPHACYVRR